MDGRASMRRRNHISMASNSSLFRCRLRKAAARFFSKRASRLLKPVTSGGTKSLVVILSPLPRPFFAPPIVEKDFLSGVPLSEERVNWHGTEGGGETEDGDERASKPSRSNTWLVGRHCCCSLSDCDSDVKRGLISFLPGCGESSAFELTDAGGEGGRV